MLARRARGHYECGAAVREGVSLALRAAGSERTNERSNENVKVWQRAREKFWQVNVRACCLSQSSIFFRYPFARPSRSLSPGATSLIASVASHIRPGWMCGEKKWSSRWEGCLPAILTSSEAISSGIRRQKLRLVLTQARQVLTEGR